MKKHKVTIIMITLFFIGLLTLFYPTLSNYYNEKNQSKTIYNYENILNEKNKIDFDKLKEDAINYNKELSELTEPLLSYENIQNYNELLNINNDGMIGYLTIDKIKVELPIYHGISNEVLNSSVGHLEGSSLPIGGNSTHSVLSAHRGLPSAKLFTDLDKLEVGDIFKITVLDEVLTYEVDKIVIVSPSDREYLKIEEDKDYVTLLTCTPYGINTHRLLVRGVRVTENTKKNYITTEGFRINRMIVIPIVALPIIVLLLLIILIKPVKRVGINKYEEFLYPNGKR
jgi:sortase A